MHYDKQLILEELKRICSSASFRARKQLQAFLSYIVYEMIAGRGDQISQYRIAVEGLNKNKDFSPVDSPIIRIEAGRLRKQLAQYYKSEGTNNPLIVTIPRGAYRPVFSANMDYDARHALHPPFNDDRRKSASSHGPRIIPYFQAPELKKQQGLYRLYCHLSGEFPLILSRFSFIELVTTERKAEEPDFDAAYFQRLWLERRADFVMRFLLKKTTEKYEVTVLLLKTIDPELVWSETFTLSTDYAEDMLQSVYYKIIGTLIVLENGLIHRVWRDQLLSQYQEDPIPNHQRVLAHFPLCDSTAKKSIKRALHICEQRLEHTSEDLVALLAFIFLCIQDQLLQLKLVKQRKKRALEACQRALLLDPTNAEAHAYYGFWAYQAEDPILAQTQFTLASKANPFDLSLQALQNHLALAEN